MPRYFRAYNDDTLYGLSRHDSGYLVNRKPLLLKMLTQKPRTHKGAQGTATRMAKSFLKKLDQMGL